MTPLDGTFLVDKTGTANQAKTHTHTTPPGGRVYYAGFTHDVIKHFSAPSFSSAVMPLGSARVLNSKVAGAPLTIDGSSSDWNLSQFTSTVHGGVAETGDIALVGYDAGNIYYAGYNTTLALPTNAADHTAKVYSRHDATYQYFLVRCDDNDMRYSNPTSANWSNDCIEFYIDPGHDHGATALSNSSSDIQLVIDANNQKNVYMCTSGYATQILNGVTSAVVRDGTGWTLEVRITKSALDPDIPANGTIGVDFNFRDNDNNNDAALSTAYAWGDLNTGAGFPTKIPDNWGDRVCKLLPTPRLRRTSAASLRQPRMARSRLTGPIRRIRTTREL
ncbi:MAG: sugar-binding protein [Armatimonadota bacterium]|nr:sugar-binding protein [Armatimonadota bacterium]